MNKWGGIFLSVAVLVGLFLGVGAPFRWNTVKDLFAATAPWAVVAAIALFWINFAVSTQRYRLLLGTMPDVSVGFVPLYRLTFLSLFLAHFVAIGPAADVIRVGYGRMKLKLPMALVVESVVYDRVLALVGLAFLGLALLPVQVVRGVQGPLLMLQLFVWLASIGAVLLAILGARANFVRDTRILARVVKSVGGFVPAVMAGGGVLAQAALAICYGASYGLAVWVISIGMGLSLELLDVLQFSPFILLAQSMPIFYMGWGARETVMVGLLGANGVVSSDQALAVSIATGVVFFVASLPGAFFWSRQTGAIESST